MLRHNLSEPIRIHRLDLEQLFGKRRDGTSLPLHEATTEVDRYISWPGQALSYYLGYLKIRELRERAEGALGERFDVRAFHDEVLRRGSVPLPVLESAIDEWLAERSRGAS